MTLNKLIKIFSNLNCNKIYVKRLAPNDNSKNQVYLGGSFDILNFFPIQEIESVDSGNWVRSRFKAKINFYWIDLDGSTQIAKHSQFILYPKYPEVRFSGFLKQVVNAPSELMASRIDGRLLFLGVSQYGNIYGFVCGPNTEVTNEFYDKGDFIERGLFKVILIESGSIELNTKEKLLSELKRIHNLGWINSKRLDSFGNLLPCSSTNCGGYTLEAELGIKPNGYAEPDYLGWEIKQFSVNKFEKYDNSIVTLMTPEPNGGFYFSAGVEDFIFKYGYKDRMGRESRLNFGGIYKYGNKTNITGLTLIIEGFDFGDMKIKDSGGFIGLIDEQGNIACSWSFSSLLKHWNTKHSNACYVPSKIHKYINQKYHFGHIILLGTGTDFSKVLSQIIVGNLYYDPGIKLEMEISGMRKKNIKRRSQFRIKSGNLISLYESHEIIDLNVISDSF